MLVTKRALIGAVVAATVVFAGLGAGAAQAAPDADKAKEGDRAATARVDASLAPDRLAKGKVTASSTATAALAAIQKRIAAYVAKNGTAYSFGSYFDAGTGRIVVETDAPDAVVSSLTSTAGLNAAQAQVAGLTQVKRTAIDDAFSRRDDVPNFYGGGGITQTAGVAWCSSGFTVQNGAGTRFMVTAGHCFANGVTVLTESGNRTYGTVSNRRLPTVTGHAQDMELIGGQGYWGRVFTGGVNSSTSLPVVAAGTAFVGYTDYCTSGRTTGENCGHTATSISGQVCTQTGCKSPVIVYTGGTLPQGGDSGGAFYAKDASSIWIRGHHIAGGGGTSYATPWLETQAAYGVSIVLG
ncbi:chymotrypsin family serine protease [Phytohabitans suffuscus]|uniref:Serine protease n=1 Tax=Phytohabitans suffuscus TaxID=624315 RepID=A0A6F8YZC9_9ACTN|nr:hypothetical protein [Phytohabitans suffuscus]BCB91353.1 hypothetical protein Psuf_086660 [Phytohabitans suffuscus]